MVLFGKALTNAMGFREQNNRLAERKADRPDKSYDFPRQPHSLPHGRYGGPRGPGPRMPYIEHAPMIYRKVGDHHDWVSGHQLDGLRRDIGPRIRPPQYYQPVFLRSSPEYPRDHCDCPSCDEYDNDPYGSYWEPDESFVDSFDDLSLGRRHSFERVRPTGFHDHRLTALPHFRHRPIQDQEDHHPYHDRHRHHQDHPHQHDHPPRRGHHGHHHSFDSDEIDGAPGGNRASGMWERSPYGIGHGLGHQYSTDASSEHGSASTW